MKKCSEVMTTNPFCCLPGDLVSEAAQLMRSENVGSIPVIKDVETKRLVGIVTDRDLALRIVAEGVEAQSTTVEAVMTRTVITCLADDDLQKALDAMADHQLRRIPVVDKDNVLVGIIAQADAATRVDQPEKLPRWLGIFREPGGVGKFSAVKRTIDKQRRDEMTNRRMTKAQFVTTLAEKSGLNKKQATSALTAINAIVAQQLGTRGPGEVLIPGLLRLSVVDKPATPQHEGVNPFTREPMTYKAKAAHKVIRARPLKALQDAV